MEKIALKEIQNIQFEMLKKFDYICRKYNIKYSIEGGSLLGAVKYGGFVPWDDDIDIVMERENYSKFIKISSSELQDTDYVLENYETIKEFPLNYSKLCYTKTKILNYDYSHLNQMSHGVFIDIFPLDYINSGKKNFRKHAIGFLTSVRKTKLGVNFSASKNKKILYKMFSIFSLKFLTKTLHYFLTKGKEKNNKYLYELCNQNSKFKPLKKEIYQEYTNLKFNGYDVMAISNYDELLKDRFGINYLNELPPEELRVPSHCDRIYWTKDLEKTNNG